MSNKGQAIEVLLCLIMVLIVVGMILSLGKQFGIAEGYKQGQIDCINGVIKYELADYKEWRKIKKED